MAGGAQAMRHSCCAARPESHDPSPVPRVLCPMPYALCPMPYARCPKQHPLCGPVKPNRNRTKPCSPAAGAPDQPATDSGSAPADTPPQRPALAPGSGRHGFGCAGFCDWYRAIAICARSPAKHGHANTHSLDPPRKVGTSGRNQRRRHFPRRQSSPHPGQTPRPIQPDSGQTPGAHAWTWPSGTVSPKLTTRQPCI